MTVDGDNRLGSGPVDIGSFQGVRVGDCFSVEYFMELAFGPSRLHDERVEVVAIYSEGCNAVEVDLEYWDDGAKKQSTFLVISSDIKDGKVGEGGHVDPSTGAYHYLLSPADVLAERPKRVDVPVVRVVDARGGELIFPLSFLQEENKCL